jgi:curved DNA-binding protein CbpA
MNATNQQIKEAYRSKALKLDPDKNKGVPSEVANAQFIQLVEAYENFGLESKE